MTSASRPRILAVSGTDTGIGKTTVTSLLLRELVSRGVRVRAMKPIETGCEPDASGELQPADGELLAEAAGGTRPLEVVAPYRFREPAAPSVAARAAGRVIEIEALVSAIRAEADEGQLLVVEGAGGLLVPIWEAVTFLDVVERLGAALLVVVGSRLGAINHAALTFEVLGRRKSRVVGYVFNDLFRGVAAEQLAMGTNRLEVARFAGLWGFRELGALPRLGNAAECGESSAAIADVVRAILEYFDC